MTGPLLALFLAATAPAPTLCPNGTLQEEVAELTELGLRTRVITGSDFASMARTAASMNSPFPPNWTALVIFDKHDRATFDAVMSYTQANGPRVPFSAYDENNCRVLTGQLNLTVWLNFDPGGDL